MNNKDIELFETIMQHFLPMTEEEQRTLLKMLIFEFLECSNKSKERKGRKYWKVQESTYSFLINLFTENQYVDIRKFIFSQVNKEYELIFEKVSQA